MDFMEVDAAVGASLRVGLHHAGRRSISGIFPDAFESMLELSWKGTKEVLGLRSAQFF
jgi:hypothetical protein